MILKMLFIAPNMSPLVLTVTYNVHFTWSKRRMRGEKYAFCSLFVSCMNHVDIFSVTRRFVALFDNGSYWKEMLNIYYFLLFENNIEIS